MNENIKEILEYYQKDIDKFENSMKNYNEEQLKTTFEQSYQRYRNHKLLLDYIANLQTIEQQYSAVLSENAELQEENKKINNIINELKEWLIFDIKMFEKLKEDNDKEYYLGRITTAKKVLSYFEKVDDDEIRELKDKLQQKENIIKEIENFFKTELNEFKKVKVLNLQEPVELLEYYVERIKELKGE